MWWGCRSDGAFSFADRGVFHRRLVCAALCRLGGLMAGFQSGAACYLTADLANQALSFTFKGTLINLGSGPGVVREVASSSTVVALYIAPLDGSPELEKLIFTSPSACMLQDASPLSLLGVTPGELGYVFSWGFSVMLFGWLCGYGVSLALGLIRRV